MSDDAGCVYFIKEFRPAGQAYVKIGFTTQLEKRLSSLQTATSYRLQIVRCLSGKMSDEKMLHKRYKNQRLQGEWFIFTENMLIEDFGLPDIETPRLSDIHTNRAIHAELGRLIRRNQQAAALLHIFISLMDNDNSITVTQSTLAEMLECSIRSVQRAQDFLSIENWIEIKRWRYGGPANTYFVNDRVAWGGLRKLPAMVQMPVSREAA